ncbi:MAG: helix-turn-helix domain-containing protein [Caulobacterales bacterium]|nr:helix-turn-helix domain-containing protein [Caulobacterales bacterium]
MAGLERISPRILPTRTAVPGRLRHAPSETLSRHRHREAFAAVVLAGGYVEAGDTGRHRVQAGDVVLHRAFESHLDRFDRPGAEVLVLPLADDWAGPVLGAVADPDLLARLAERDAGEAEAALGEALRPGRTTALDWPDLLALHLREDARASLSAWADGMGLRLGSVSRGFRQVYGVSPQAFRLVQRAHQALDAILRTDAPLSGVALACGFADQAHMSRAVAALADAPPARLRRQARMRAAA